MEYNITFSIVVSVYNIELYIESCVQSILNQRFQDFELIIIDDGSTDDSYKKIEKYLKNKNVFYYFKDNGGASSARNYGLNKAKGKYIFFLDGDDYWDDTNALTSINENIEQNPDFVLFSCKDLNCTNNKIEIKRKNYKIELFEKGNKKEILNHLFSNDIFPGAAWLLCVQKEFLLRYNILFKEGIKAEDLDWLVSVFYYSNKIIALNQSFYIYRKNRINSSTYDFNDKSINGIFFLINRWKELLKNNENNTLLLSLLNRHFVILILFSSKIDNRIYLHKDLLKFSKGIKYSVISKLIQIVGINYTNKLFKTIF